MGMIGAIGWRGVGLPPAALGRAGTRPAPTGEGEGARCVCDVG